jgi:hypothetical protein
MPITPQQPFWYLKSVGWLLVPVLVWNAVLAERLPRAFSPEVFEAGISSLLSTAENSLRIVLFALPFIAPLELVTKRQRRGMGVFVAGLAIYFTSWLPLINLPNSAWSVSAIGFLAPAYTPLVWQFGLALLMQRLYWRSPYRWWMYLTLSLGFLVVHISHAAIVFNRVFHSGGG